MSFLYPVVLLPLDIFLVIKMLSETKVCYYKYVGLIYFFNVRGFHFELSFLGERLLMI